MLGSIGKKLSDIYTKGKDIIGDAFEGTGFDDPTSHYGTKRFEMRAIDREQKDLRENHPVMKNLAKISLLEKNLERTYAGGKMTKDEYDKEKIALDEEHTKIFKTDEFLDYSRKAGILWEKENDVLDQVYTLESNNLRVNRQGSRSKGEFDLPLLSKLGRWLMD